MSDLELFVVDDDAPVRRALDRLLRVAGYRVRAFASAHDVLEELPYSTPACMIIDVRMPERNGLELFETLRSTRESIPVIFITGHGDIAMAVRAMKAGAADFLAKPFDDKALLDAVAQATSKAARR
jgi:FixJ family two-component response regulator